VMLGRIENGSGTGEGIGKGKLSRKAKERGTKRYGQSHSNANSSCLT
jgi:hypothetical protein